MISQRKPGPAVSVRPYQDEDEAEVLVLLQDALGGGPVGARSADFFRWKHQENPFGPSFMLVAETDGSIVGLRAFMRWRFWSTEGDVQAVRAVDTATHPEHQGRGIFSLLTKTALDQLQGRIDLVFNTPNGKSGPGYLKLGWRSVGKIPIRARIRRPIRFVGRIRSITAVSEPQQAEPPGGAVRAEDALGDTDWTRSLLATAPGPAAPLKTPVSIEYLRWRYARPPGLDYFAVTDRDQLPGGLAIFRIRRRGRLTEAAVTEVIVAEGDRKTARRLLRRLVRSASVDLLTCSFPAGSAPAWAARRSGFVRSPGGMTFVVNPRRDLRMDVAGLDSWALTLGDLEVF